MKKKLIELINHFEPRAWWREKLADKIKDVVKDHIEGYPKMTDGQLYDVCEKFRPDIANFAEPKAVEEAVRNALIKSLE